jgi:hypothetical protein
MRDPACGGELFYFFHQKRKNIATVSSFDTKNLCKCPFIYVHTMWFNLWDEM